MLHDYQGGFTRAALQNVLTDKEMKHHMKSLLHCYSVMLQIVGNCNGDKMRKICVLTKRPDQVR